VIQGFDLRITLRQAQGDIEFFCESGDNHHIYFSSADIGWITGHTYLIYGPLLNGATSLMFERIPTYPTASRFWEVIKKHKVNIFYTAPTATRSLMQKGDKFIEGQDLSSLKILGSVGEPINEEAWRWYFEKVGNKKCPIVDTWWQTETWRDFNFNNGWRYTKQAILRWFAASGNCANFI